MILPVAQALLIPDTAEIVTIFSQTITSGNSGDENGGYRMIVPVTGDARRQIRVTFQGSTGGSFSVDNAAIQLQQSTQNAIGVPTELFFDGKSGFTIAAGVQIVSDWVNFSGFRSSDKLLVVMDLGATNGNAGTNGTVTGGTFYFKAATDSYNTATMGTPDFTSANEVQGIAKIEVR